MADRSLTYEAFVRDKLALRPPSGMDGGFTLPPSLFPHQKALTSWALRRGRAAIFADTVNARASVSWKCAVNALQGKFFQFSYRIV